MPRPVIGLSCYVEPARWGSWHLPAALIPEWYLDLIHRGGADVLVLPPGNDPSLLDRLDGLALAGGADVDSRLYGAEPHPASDIPRESRDESELALYRRARELSMPVLGICRGMQLMAVAHGGSLIQHVPDLEGEIVHREAAGTFVEHTATFTNDSLAGRLFGAAPVVVNSSHHQAVDSAGDLMVSGWADDGTVESCEDPAADFCVGVQWHPEHPDRVTADAPLVAAFVAAAERYALSR
ncbi:MAG: gamma-glutamyl-gamma-aminobutyrate hydrolase family protein [bacterium]|nr:gamma-glutamyl-gamma-aminobutyrate hydrolase family protein [bacterium]